MEVEVPKPTRAEGRGEWRSTVSGKSEVLPVQRHAIRSLGPWFFHLVGFHHYYDITLMSTGVGDALAEGGMRSERESNALYVNEYFLGRFSLQYCERLLSLNNPTH